MTGGLVGSSTPLADRFDLALVDLDGVAYRGHEPIDGAAEGLTSARERGMRLVFVTNNASREPESVADQLTDLGIVTHASEVMTAAQAAAQLLRTRLPRGAKVLVVGGAGLVTAVRAAGYEVVHSADDEPAAVAQGFAPEVGWPQLAEAAYADRSRRVARGVEPRPEPADRPRVRARNGSLVGAVQAATGVVPDSAGKPSPTMYRMAVERVGARETLVIGDRLDTDLAGARAGGYIGLHVLTGVSSARDDVLAVPGERPHLIGADLRSLLVAHPEPQQAGEGWWTVRDASARVVDGGLEIGRGTPSSVEDHVDVVRAACAAAWAAVDAGGEVDPRSVPELVMGPATA